ncbi:MULTISPECIES: acyltransferase family protein [Methanoculleus]|uniref:Acyltransferase 3 n=2 Tax=Methanoculleus TaxID=45989 RepID=A3CSR1_METMJ|nr:MULTISPECIES: acyltransferase [Methanoculleus]ABN56411.1 acyltransferase 3 [Methanoculleus marisnigri JR1]MCC7556108.1 acyltransferase [Methanoculleus marisnigri]UYU17858.1 acyltransferase [Methanoculleus submarinus]
MKTEHPGAVTEAGSIPGGRFSNNFDFLRFAAAAMIVVAHAYALRLGYVGIGLYDPVMLMAQAGLAALLVTSGYLITASWESTASPLRFAWKRSLRVIPALVLVILVTLFVIGPLMTSLSPGEYFAALFSPAGLATAPFFEDGSAIGLFQGNPWTYVNGSLWTIPVEVMMYGVVAALGIAGLLHRWGAIPALAAVNILVWIYWFDDPRMAKVRFTLYFLAGAYLYLHRERIAYRPVVAGVLLLLLGLSAMTPYLTVAAVIAIPYLTIYAAHIPVPSLSTFGRPGDFSYGIYIYHYPIQQVLIQTTANTLHLAVLCGVSFLATFVLAFFSWHAVEKRALAAKSLGTDDLRRKLRLPSLPESLTAWWIARK